MANIPGTEIHKDLLIITNVQSRNCLYDKAYARNTVARNKAWKEIEAVMQKNVYKEITEIQIQTRWTSIRDCFVRARRKGAIYKYHAQLAFLVEHLSNNKSNNSSIATTKNVLVESSNGATTQNASQEINEGTQSTLPNTNAEQVLTPSIDEQQELQRLEATFSHSDEQHPSHTMLQDHIENSGLQAAYASTSKQGEIQSTLNIGNEEYRHTLISATEETLYPYEKHSMDADEHSQDIAEDETINKPSNFLSPTEVCSKRTKLMSSHKWTLDSIKNIHRRQDEENIIPQQQQKTHQEQPQVEKQISNTADLSIPAQEQRKRPNGLRIISDEQVLQQLPIQKRNKSITVRKESTLAKLPMRRTIENNATDFNVFVSQNFQGRAGPALRGKRGVHPPIDNFAERNRNANDNWDCYAAKATNSFVSFTEVVSEYYTENTRYVKKKMELLERNNTNVQVASPFEDGREEEMLNTYRMLPENMKNDAFNIVMDAMEGVMHNQPNH